MADHREDRTRPREWLAIPADDATAELVAVVLEAGATTRRQAGLAIAEELMAEKREQGKDIRSGAVKLAEVLAEASTLERVARQVRDRHLPAIEVDVSTASADVQAVAQALGQLTVSPETAAALGRLADVHYPDPAAPRPKVGWTYDADGPPPPAPVPVTAHEVDLGDGRIAWVPDADAVAAALGIDEGDEVPEVDEPDPADVVPIDPAAE